MGRPLKYTPEQITAILALSALQPRPSMHVIADAVGVPFDTVRYHVEGRSKVKIIEPWAQDVVTACVHRFKGSNDVAAYYLVSAAKHLLKKQPI